VFGIYLTSKPVVKTEVRSADASQVRPEFKADQPLPSVVTPSPVVKNPTKQPTKKKTQQIPQPSSNEAVTVKVEKGAKWISTNDKVYAINGATAIDNQGDISSKGLQVNPPAQPPVTVNCGTGGICAGRDITGNPTIENNFAPQAKLSFVVDDDPRITTDTGRPFQCVKISSDMPLDSAKFAVICNHACEAIRGGAILTYGGIGGGDKWGSISDYPNVAAFIAGNPNPMPSNVKYRACVESDDDEAIQVVDVKKLILPEDKK